jgi:hypothetical protein
VRGGGLRQRGQQSAEPDSVDPAAVQRVVHGAVPAPVLGGQGQVDWCGHRSLNAQQRVGELEERVAPRSQACMEDVPEV